MSKKRIIIISLIVVVLVGIGFYNEDFTKKPDDIRENIYQYGLSALETIDEFIDEKVDAYDAVKKLDNVYSRIETEMGDEYSTSEYLLSYYISDCISDVKNKGEGIKTFADVIESRNKVAESLKEDLR